MNISRYSKISGISKEEEKENKVLNVRPKLFSGKSQKSTNINTNAYKNANINSDINNINSNINKKLEGLSD